MSTFTGQFFCAQIALFKVNLVAIVRNATSQKQLCAIAKLELKV